MILLSTILTISKRRLEKNSFEILPGSGIEITGCPLAPTYRYILYWLSGKSTSKRASWNYAKLAPGQVLSKTICQPLQVPHQFEWNEHIKDNELELFWTLKTFWMSIYTKNWASVCKTLCTPPPPNICLPLNMATFTQCLISTQKLDFAEKLNR